MDLRVSDYSFKGTKLINKLPGIIMGTAMTLGTLVSCQDNSQSKDSFTKNIEYVTLPYPQSEMAGAEDVLTTLNKTRFFPAKDNEIIASILSSLGVESLGCMNTGDRMDAFGECSTMLYKFYVRKADNGSYYGIADRLAGMDTLDLVEFSESRNKSFAFELKDFQSKNSTEGKQLILVELKPRTYEYSHNFIFGDEIYDNTNDIEDFRAEYFDEDTRNIVFKLKE